MILPMTVMSCEIATKRPRRRLTSASSRSYMSASRPVVSVSQSARAVRSCFSAVPTRALSRVCSKPSGGRATSACSAVRMLAIAFVNLSSDGATSQAAADRSGSQFLSTGGAGSSASSLVAFSTLAAHSTRRLLLSCALRRRTAASTRPVTVSAIRSRALTNSVKEKAETCLAIAARIPTLTRTSDRRGRAFRASRLWPGSQGEPPARILSGEPSAITVLTSTLLSH